MNWRKRTKGDGSILIENYGPKVIRYKGHEIQPGTVFEDTDSTDVGRDASASSDPTIKKGDDMRDRLIGWGIVVVFLIAMILMVSCGGPTKTAHLYRNINGGSVVNCPEELDPVPTEWEYLGTAELPEDDVLSQCELE